MGEYFFNKRIAEGVHARIMAQPGQIKSFLINDRDGNMSLAERPKIAAQKKADLLLSIHHDSVQPKYISFWQVNGQSIVKAIKIYWGFKNNGANSNQ